MKSAWLLVFLGVAGCGIPKATKFYQTPPVAGASPGTLIAVAPYNPSVEGAAAYRVLYNSTDIDGATIPVSGVVYIPLAAAPPQGRNIVAWAHPTTGIAQGCAPSLGDGGIGALTLAQSIPGIDRFIADGDVVAATDYPGLGTPGVHPYLIGDGEGRSIIDSVRAARALPGANTSGKYVVWGHSQGGQAALFAGQIAKTYAPELELVGVAAAAPPTDMNIELTEPFRSNSGRLLAAYIYYSWGEIYHVPITSIVYRQAVPAVNNIVTKCIDTLGQAISAVHAAAALNPVFRSHNPNQTPPWPALLTENSPGGAPPGAPVLIVQGSVDTTVEPYFTRHFVAAACAREEILDYQEFNTGHLAIAVKSSAMVANWIHDRFAGLKPPDNCKG
jgi:pimeloyl-ACP methyl ester carboxylesterase